VNGRPTKIGVQQDTCGIDYITQQTGVKFGGKSIGIGRIASRNG
jgi:hypothetical protein